MLSVAVLSMRPNEAHSAVGRTTTREAAAHSTGCLIVRSTRLLHARGHWRASDAPLPPTSTALHPTLTGQRCSQNGRRGRNRKPSPMCRSGTRHNTHAERRSSRSGPERRTADLARHIPAGNSDHPPAFLKEDGLVRGRQNVAQLQSDAAPRPLVVRMVSTRDKPLRW